MKLNSNKGMYLEEIINNSITYYKRNNIALIHKLPIPIKIFENNDNIIKGRLYLKSNVDYYGVYKGIFVCVEAKQTNTDYFVLNNIQEHQKSYLDLVNIHGGISILIIYFNKYNLFFKLDYQQIKDMAVNRLSIDWFKINCIQLSVYLPGRIDFLINLEVKK